MTAITRLTIGELLGSVRAPGSFTARRTAEADDLHLEVTGFGRLRFPVSRTGAQRLCRLARPARYGQGERTLLDPRVRDTCEIPKSRVKIDKRRWNRTLLPVLEALRADLGLAEGSRLRAELHSMLVYGPGQFFRRHRDSEKADEMVGTLVVTLPSSYKGGALTVEHRGEKVTYRASRRPLSLVAFYADCDHEAKPVTEGYRIVLTYNLMLTGDAGDGGAAAPDVPAATVAALAERLREHFETPLPPRRWSPEDAPPRDPPNRFVYLLDHQYTERGFGWARLKGDDAARAAALTAAADRAGCETVLALAEVREIWDCMEPGWSRPQFGRRRRWERDEDDEWEADDEWEPQADLPDAYELGELQDSEITLARWIGRSGEKAEPIVTRVGGDEVCATTPSSALEPYASEYEGYMGNWGNTMDRWYRRAAIVVWPRERTFAVRAEAAPGWALEEIERRLRAGEAAEARAMAASVAPFWAAVAGSDERKSFLARALRVAAKLGEAAPATVLLQPFRVEALTPPRARDLAALADRYGEEWMRALLTSWSDSRRAPLRSAETERGAWIVALPGLCAALRSTGGGAGGPVARLLLEVAAWRWLKASIEAGRERTSPSRRDQALAALAKPLGAYFDGAAAAGADALRDEAVAFLCAGDDDLLVPALVPMLRAAGNQPAAHAAPALDAVARHCAARLEARLARPERDSGDWSLALPAGCRCELCTELAGFLADPEAVRLEWPLAEERRRHVHSRLDAHELPVRHETRRTGRPYTLVLAKTRALFDDEARERRSWRKDLEWLRATSGRLRREG